MRRRLTWRFEEDGSLSGTFRLPPLQGAVLLKALRAACADLAAVIRAGAFPRKRPRPRSAGRRGSARRGRAGRAGRGRPGGPDVLGPG